MSAGAPAVGKPLALTFGEPAGIGPDISLAAWLLRDERDLPPFCLIADPDYLKGRAKLLGCQVDIEEVDAAAAVSTFARALPVVPLREKARAGAGIPDETSAPA